MDDRVTGKFTRLDFQPPAWLKNPHTQSVMASSKLRLKKIAHDLAPMKSASRPMLLEGGDGQLLGYLSAPAPGRPLVILLHGWEGSGESVYLQSAAAWLYRQGYAVLRLHLRDHGDSHHLNRDLFHSCRDPEVTRAILHAMERIDAPSYQLIGFSLGGSFALRSALGCEQAGRPLDGVISVCPPLEPKHTLHAMQTGPAIYHYYFMRKWRRSLIRKNNCHPGLCPPEQWRQFGRMDQLTDYFVREHSDFHDLDRYFSGYSLTGDRLASMHTTAAMLLSEDDPICLARDLDRTRLGPGVQAYLTRYGGHCGFIDHLGLNNWLNRRLLDWLHEQCPATSAPVTD